MVVSPFRRCASSVSKRAVSPTIINPSRNNLSVQNKQDPRDASKQGSDAYSFNGSKETGLSEMEMGNNGKATEPNSVAPVGIKQDINVVPVNAIDN